MRETSAGCGEKKPTFHQRAEPVNPRIREYSGPAFRLIVKPPVFCAPQPTATVQNVRLLIRPPSAAPYITICHSLKMGRRTTGHVSDHGTYIRYPYLDISSYVESLWPGLSQLNAPLLLSHTDLWSERLVISREVGDRVRRHRLQVK